MRLITAVAVLAMMAIAAGGANAAEPGPAQVAAARAAAKGLGEKIRGQLDAAIAAGGPVSALGVCRTVAPELAAQAGADQGLKVRRTSLRVRNPANAPDDWERAVLQSFAGKVQAGADPATLEHAEITTGAGGAGVFRYMKAIPMRGKPCMTCHGAPEPSLGAEIRKLYPADQATGFRPGDLRGAFSVTGRAAAPAPAPAAAPAPAP